MGEFQTESFRAIQEYFQRKACRYCDHSFTSDGIELVREEPGIMVVRVACLSCGKPLGVAIVGTGSIAGTSSSATTIKATASLNRSGSTSLSWRTRSSKNKHPDWTKRDCKRLSGRPAISYDDVLAAHEFFKQIGTDWAKYLPDPSQSG